VLLLQWEDDDLGVRQEREGLQTVFMAYGFRTETWLIPADRSHRRLMTKMTQFINDNEDERALLIVYYGGHATINRERQSTWIWYVASAIRVPSFDFLVLLSGSQY
jgi:hypothetical protein